MVRSAPLLTLALALLAGAALGQEGWLARVSPSDHSRSNPLAGQPAAITAGRRLFVDNCARCHGQNAEGQGARPALHTERTAGETDGDFFWILEHGNKFHGMPAWSDLPEQQIWQLVAYLRSLQPAASHAPPGPGAR